MELTNIIGHTGRYQRAAYLLAFYSSWFLGSTVVTMDLMAPMVTIYWDWDVSTSNRTSFSSVDCDMEIIMNHNRTSNLSHSGSKLVYESEYSRWSLTEQWGLVCDRSWFVSLANFVSLAAYSLGCIILHLSEKFGRKPMIILSAFASIVFALCMSFSVGYAMFAVSFCLFRASAGEAAMLIFIQAVEVSTPSRRPYVGILLKSGVLVGQTVFVCAAWILKDWFNTQLVQTVLSCLLLPSVWYMTESPVWLVVRGRYDEARHVVKLIVKRNGLNTQGTESKIEAWIEETKIRCENGTRVEDGKIKELFKNRRITMYTCGLTYVMSSTVFIYNGLVVNAESFGSGLLMDLTASSTFSLVAVLSITPLLKKYSIRLILFLGFLLEGLTSLVYPVTCGFPLARTIVSVLGRFFISPIFAVINVYSNEVLPTSVRGVGTGFITFVSFVASSPAPFTKELGEITSVYVPFILFAFLSFSSALVYKFMPETKGKPMTHTVQELKRYSHGRK